MAAVVEEFELVVEELQRRRRRRPIEGRRRFEFEQMVGKVGMAGMVDMVLVLVGIVRPLQILAALERLAVG